MISGPSCMMVKSTANMPPRNPHFEAAAIAASLAVRQGHEVHVSVPGLDEGGFDRAAENGPA